MATWTDLLSVNVDELLLEEDTGTETEFILLEEDTGDESEYLLLEEEGANTRWTDLAAEVD